MKFPNLKDIFSFAWFLVFLGLGVYFTTSIFAGVNAGYIIAYIILAIGFYGLAVAKFLEIFFNVKQKK